ncbi:uncharacterized protein SAPINGB_P002385 [Magnusiomyces paraingens]|uniref:Uncharacterized protein n=1 Tax=Magnusiomyces paraingens TaxID=2606893 RepID=A0A5E8BFR5_9ASCO|nr:uncharacterized protein SAPINGB_P002385 [Saprochaete ingens]VVT49671.1 unnamed protein product [Saprochaete ingens]
MTPALGALGEEAASFPDTVSDKAAISLMPSVDSSAPRSIEEAQEHRLSLDAEVDPLDDSPPPTSAPSSSSSGTTANPYPLIYNPKDSPSNLHVSGRVINALSQMPHAVVYNTDDKTFDLRHRRGNSALYSALSFLKNHEHWESLIVAWTGEIETKATVALDNIHQDNVDISAEDAKLIEQKYRERETEYGETHPIWLLGQDQFRWREYAEKIIWPILHYIQGEPTDGIQEQQWWRSYLAFNEAYANRIIDIYKPGDIIWIHDYYLLLLPQLLRMKLPNAYIGSFLHSPFSSSEYFRVIPKRKELLEGMLGANLVATQSYAFSRHFISACTRLLNLESRPNYISAYGVHVSVDTIPIGIDTEAVERDAFSPIVDKKVSALRSLYPSMKLIIGRDRLDSVRGVVQKLYAFEMFLNLYPEWIGKVVLIQVTSPAYANTDKMEEKIAEMISHINGTYGSLDYSPIQHYPRHVARDEYFALLRGADLGLITSVRDGMNTTSLEFVICQKFKNSPLILSEFTGTAGLLVDAVQVNPWDSVGVAQTINQCLLQSPERNAVVQDHLYKTVTSNTVHDWVVRFLSRLIHNLSRHDQSHMTPTLDRALLLQQYQKAEKRLFLFDYDGTLTPIVREPSAAIPSARLYKTLELLTSDPRNHVWIISGRDSEFLDKWLGHNKAIGFSAEHGCFFKNEGSSEWVNLAEQVDMSWRNDARAIFDYFTERTQGSHVEVKQAALTWHYRRADPELGQFQAQALKAQLEKQLVSKYDVEVMEGKANIEVRPRQFNKGEIVKRLVREIGEGLDGGRPGFVYCLGDDKTDEDMFTVVSGLSTPSVEPSGDNEEVSESNAKAAKAAYERGLDGLFPVTVGPANKRTGAAWHLIDPEAVLDTLAVLTGEIPLEEVVGLVDIDERGRSVSSAGLSLNASNGAHTVPGSEDLSMDGP